MDNKSILINVDAFDQLSEVSDFKELDDIIDEIDNDAEDLSAPLHIHLTVKFIANMKQSAV
jgi:hypothetical protein